MSTNTQVVTVDFHGQQILAIQNGEEIRVSVASICNNVGLQVEAQRKRIRRHPVLSKGESMMDFPSSGGNQEMLTLPLKMIPGWLMGVDVNRVNPEIRHTLIQYQEECFDVLWQYFSQGEAINPRFDYAVNPGDKLTKDQADLLRNLLTDAAKKTFPSDTKRQGSFIMQGWSKLKAHFKVGYRQIPQGEFTEAVSIVSRHVLSGEYLPAGDPAAKATTPPVSEAALLTAAQKALCAGQRFYTLFREGSAPGEILPILVPLSSNCRMLTPQEVVDEIATDRLHFFPADMIKDLLWALSCRLNPARLMGGEA